MNHKGYKPAEGFFSPGADTEQVNAIATRHADTAPQPISGPSNYSLWRQQRLAERLRKAGSHAAVRWNHLITVVACGSDDDIAALPRTLGSLLAQRYRNIEVLVVGMPLVPPCDTGDFASCRGLFAEPDVGALDLLSDPATDPLWRGSHLIFANAGTEFDPDAVELFNTALDSLADVTAPALVVCDHDRLSGGGSDDCAPSILPGWGADVTRSLDKLETAFMVSRTLLQLARRQLQRPTSLQDWLRGIATMTPPPHFAHIAETLIHIPQTQPSSRPSSDDAQ